MAIGIPLPLRHIPRFRLPWRYAGTMVGRHTRVLRAGILRVVSVTRTLAKRIAHGARDFFSPRVRARKRQHAHFSVFEHKYEALVDLLCAAAHEGIRHDRETLYQRIRSWMMVHYPGIAKQVRTHWRSGEPQLSDPFQSLFIPLHLAEAIHRDTAIDDIMRSRAAIDAYHAHLKSA